MAEQIGRFGVGKTATFAPLELEFTDGEPDCLFLGEHGGTLPYRGQAITKERAKRYIDGLGLARRRFKALLTGPAGTGKTTLARILAKYIAERQMDLEWSLGGGYYELLPDMIESKPQLDAFMSMVQFDPYAVVFVDEIHALKIREALFHTLHDSGTPRYPLNNGAWIEIPDTISWIGATTDPGEMDDTNGGALLRRFQPELELEPPTLDELAEIISDQGTIDRIRIHSDAAYDIAERSVFPWQAKFIYKEARDGALLDGSKELTPAHAADAFRLQRVDKQGLLPKDRAVIKALLQVNGGKGISLVSQPDVTRYRMAEAALCGIAGVDPKTYKKQVQPKLLRLGLLTVIGGQCLTERAVELYEHLRTA